EELLGMAPPASPESDAAKSESVVKEAAALGLDPATTRPSEDGESVDEAAEAPQQWDDLETQPEIQNSNGTAVGAAPAPLQPTPLPINGTRPTFQVSFNRGQLHEAIEIVRQLDPSGVACRDLRECLLYQLRYHQAQLGKNGNGTGQVLQDAIAIVDQNLRALQNKQHKEIARAINR